MRTYLYLFLLVLITIPFAVHGQTSNNTFVPLQPNLPGIKEFAQSNSIPELLNNIYKICIGIAATLAVLQIMRAGVLYMGGDSVTEKKEAKDLISSSIVGLILVLSPVIVFSIINPNILSLQIDAGSLRNANQSGSGATGGSGAAQPTPFPSPQYLLVGHFVRNAGGTTCSVLVTPTYYPTIQACQARKTTLETYVKAPPAGTTYSQLTFDKTCTQETAATYVQSAPQPAQCSN